MVLLSIGIVVKIHEIGNHPTLTAARLDAAQAKSVLLAAKNDAPPSERMDTPVRPLPPISRNDMILEQLRSRRRDLAEKLPIAKQRGVVRHENLVFDVGEAGRGGAVVPTGSDSLALGKASTKYEDLLEEMKTTETTRIELPPMNYEAPEGSIPKADSSFAESILSNANLTLQEKIERLQTRYHNKTEDYPSFDPMDRQECRYEGHCMEGLTCVADGASSIGGYCIPFQPTASPRDDNDDADDKTNPHSNENMLPETDPCFQACMYELKWDDYFQYQAEPKVQTSFRAVNGNQQRPDGCVIQYERYRPSEDWEEFTEPQWWNATQAHRVVRVDPARPSDATVSWVAFCYDPCQSDADCGNANAYTCHHPEADEVQFPHGGVCRPRESYWNPTDELQHDLVFVSGADSGYFEALANLAASLRYWAPQHKLVVYNLGMTEEQLRTIVKNKRDEWSNVAAIKWMNGFPEDYPSHISIGKRYAWKPIAMNESVHEYGSIFWLDAGSTVVGNLTEAIRIVRQTGIFLMKGQDLDMMPLANKDTFTSMGHTKSSFQGGPHYSGNTQAYLYPSKYIDSIVRPNALCAINSECICPESSHLHNHRYDQTTLSVLAYRDHLRVPHYTQFLAAGRDQLQVSLSDPSFRFVWTSRGGCDYYIYRERKNANRLDEYGDLME